jgi:hypothetical protein
MSPRDGNRESFFGLGGWGREDLGVMGLGLLVLRLGFWRISLGKL